MAKRKLTVRLLVFSCLLPVSSLSEESDMIDGLIGSYTQVLLIGHACSDHGAGSQEEIREQTIRDFVEFGMTEEAANEVVFGLLASEGPRIARIIAEESKSSPEGTILYCTNAYASAVSKLDHARLAVMQALDEAEQDSEADD